MVPDTQEEDDIEEVLLPSSLINDGAPKSSLFTTSFNLLNNMVGSTLLSVPWAMNQVDKSGVNGITFLVCVAFVSWSSYAFIGLVCEASSTKSFDALAKVAGISQSSLVKALLGVYTWLSCVSHVMLTSDFISGENGLMMYWETQWCDNSEKCSFIPRWFHHRTITVAFLAICALFPFSQFSDFESLKPVSILSFIFMCSMVGISVYFWVSEPHASESSSSSLRESVKGAGLAHPIFLISFAAQYNGPKFYAELKHASAKRFAFASGVSVVFALLIYTVLGWTSLKTFGQDLKSNLLSNYATDSKLAVCARLAMSVVVLTTYPLTFQAMSSCLPEWLSSMKVSLVILTALPACFLTDIGVVLDYKGSVFGGLISLFIPALAYHTHFHADGNTEWKRVAAVGVMLWALVASCAGFITTTAHLV